MLFALSEEQAELAGMVRDLLRKRSDSQAVRAAVGMPRGYDESLWSVLCQQVGAAALAIPEEYGGAGFTLFETHVVLEELGAALTPSPLLGSGVLAAQAPGAPDFSRVIWARPHAWRFRDWVINALNGDMPFDEFTIQQLAGDLLPDATPHQRAATGFHRNTLTNREGGVDQEEFRVAATVDRVNTTATVWLGLTAGCAQCHNHPYDPLSQREFYEFRQRWTAGLCRAFAFDLEVVELGHDPDGDPVTTDSETWWSRLQTLAVRSKYSDSVRKPPIHLPLKVPRRVRSGAAVPA